MSENKTSNRVALGAALLVLPAAAAASLGWLVSSGHKVEAPSGTAGGVAQAMPREELTLVTATGQHSVSVEVARGPEAQSLGLMFRTELADGHGMLFPHEVQREAAMWMKNTYIPLDMVFIKSDGRVHRIHRNAKPHSTELIASGGPVAAVLELPAGAADRYGLKAGDRVRHPHFDPGGG